MTSSSPPDQQLSRAQQLALLGAASYASLQLTPSAPDVPETPDFGGLWRALMVEFTSLHIDRVRGRLQELSPELADLHWSRERAWHAEFMARSYTRIRQDFTGGMTPERMQEIRRREVQWGRAHYLAAARRARRIIEHVSLREADPRDDHRGGAIWLMDLSKKTHTDDCTVMNGHTWSWAVLRWINPANRHAGCGCTLYASSAEPIDEMPPGVPVGFDIGPIQPRTLFGHHPIPSAQDLIARMS